MHLGKLMELRSSKSQMPLSDNNPVLPERKGVGFGFCFSRSCTVKMEEGLSVGKARKAMRELRADELIAQETNSALSLRVHRAYSLLCSLTAHESNLG